MRRHPPVTQIKIFRSISWYETNVKSSTDYISHLLIELGRLGLEIHDIESHARPPRTEAVLSDLLDWLNQGHGGAHSKIVNWQWLDLQQIQSRLDQDAQARPRIEISAHITKMNNLSVRWYPGGWGDAQLDWNQLNTFNLVAQRKWRQKPDFHRFRGDEEPTFNGRPSNELMYIRGVGNLHPEPREDYGPYSRYNDDVVDSLLICAVRAAYEGLIAELKSSFEVEVVDVFDFVTRDEIDEQDKLSARFPTHRVVGWSLENAADLQARREIEAAAKKEQLERSEFENIQVNFGLAPEEFMNIVLRAASKKSTGPAPSTENVNRNAAKTLRAAGFPFDASSVHRVRYLIERYRPELLPESTRDSKSPESHPSNVLRFPDDRG